jgi:hypothetical protein
MPLDPNCFFLYQLEYFMNNKNSANPTGRFRSFIETISGANGTALDVMKLFSAFLLATGCWVSYGIIVHRQFSASHKFANDIAEIARKGNPSQEDRERIILIKDANDMVNQTAGTIYTLLTPVAAGITSFFFVASGSKKIKDPTAGGDEATDPETEPDPVPANPDAGTGLNDPATPTPRPPLAAEN